MPNPPPLPAGAPPALVDFVSCKTDTYTLTGGAQGWIGEVDLGITSVVPDVTFEPGATPGSVNAVVGKGGFGITIPVSVSDGSLSADTSSLPTGPAGQTNDWIRQFNENLRSNGKQVGGITVRDGKATITKAARGGAGAGTGNAKKLVAAGAAAVVVVAGGLALSSGKNNAVTPSPSVAVAKTPSSPPYPARSWELQPITAEFVQDTFSTDYRVAATGKPLGNPRDGAWTVTWKLELTLVDKAGTPDPSAPTSGAAVDLGCNNATWGTAKPVSDYADLADRASFFSWVHPSPPDSKPLGAYHCDHLDQGPHGHQGLITVTVTDGYWICTESYRGTHTGTSTGTGQPGAATCVKDPQASPHA